MSVFVSSTVGATPATIQGNPTPSTSWQWRRDGVEIAGATSSSYVVTTDDTGQNLTVVQTATNFVGTASATSAGLGPVLPFSPIALFANGEQGWWYDPSNFATLFQDSAGTTPVTAVEQPVGLQLDLSQGLVLGPELVTNGDFSDGSTGWTLDAAATVSGGTLNISTAISLVVASQSFSLTAGKMYEVRATCTSRTSGAAGIGTKTGATVSAFTITAAGDYRAYIFAGTANDGIRVFSTGAGFTGSIDNISVKELPGNHRFQSTSANRPVVSARVNLLTKTEQFEDAVWQRAGVNRQILPFGSGSVVNATTAPNGTTTADLVVPNTTSAVHYVGSQANTSAAGTYKIICYAKPSGYSWILLQLGSGGNGAGTYFNVSTGQIGSNRVYGTGFSASSPDITPVGDGWYLCEVVVTATAALGYADIVFSNGNGDANLTFAGNGTSGIFIWGADFRPTNQGVNLPAYQRVNTSTDYDSTGFPVYIKPNGSNQFMQTNSINFTATDKMTVWQGVRKLTNTGQFIHELSASLGANNGTFSLEIFTDTKIYAASRGTNTADVATGVLSTTLTAVTTTQADISAPQILLRLNGAQVAQSTATQGTGNYGNYPAYFYMRGGTLFPFNGNDYGSIARGAASTAAQITNGEAYINTLTKAYGFDFITTDAGDQIVTDAGDLVITDNYSA
jgi:hypothetical protein